MARLRLALPMLLCVFLLTACAPSAGGNCTYVEQDVYAIGAPPNAAFDVNNIIDTQTYTSSNCGQPYPQNAATSPLSITNMTSNGTQVYITYSDGSLDSDTISGTTVTHIPVSSYCDSQGNWISSSLTQGSFAVGAQTITLEWSWTVLYQGCGNYYDYGY